MGTFYYPTWICYYECESNYEFGTVQEINLNIYGQNVQIKFKHWYQGDWYGTGSTRVGGCRSTPDCPDPGSIYYYETYDEVTPLEYCCEMTKLVLFDANLPITAVIACKPKSGGENCAIVNVIPDIGEHDAILHIGDGESEIISENIKMQITYKDEFPIRGYLDQFGHIEAAWASMGGLNDQCLVYVNNPNTGQKFFKLNGEDVTSIIADRIAELTEAAFDWGKMTLITARFEPLRD